MFWKLILFQRTEDYLKNNETVWADPVIILENSWVAALSRQVQAGACVVLTSLPQAPGTGTGRDGS